MQVWLWIGFGSLAWSLIEMVTGQAWLHREIYRDEEPTFYWVVVFFWLGLGLWCLLPFVGML